MNGTGSAVACMQGLVGRTWTMPSLAPAIAATVRAAAEILLSARAHRPKRPDGSCERMGRPRE